MHYANCAFEKSELKEVKVVEAAVEEIKREEFGPANATFSADLENITNNGRGGRVNDLRKVKYADVVSLMREEGKGVWGIAWELQKASSVYAEKAYNVVWWKQAAKRLVFAHELGHNLGASHNPENVDAPGLFEDSFGYHFSAGGTHYGTVMSYLGQRIPYYSNPKVKFKDQPTGVERKADNARAIKEGAKIVSQHWESISKSGS